MVEMWPNIPSSAQYFLIAWIVLLIFTLILFAKKHRLLPVALALTVFSIASAFALFSPYLFRWDEQFHALVGKNLASNPFHPILIDLDPSLWHPFGWANTYIWLHKQPLFLYQIALSVKVLGATVYAVRLPSILLHVLGALAIYDMGKMMLNRNLGLLAALIFSVSAFPLGLLSGRIGTDHNDSVFMIYVLLSFWAWFKFYTQQNKKWAKWIGVFVGCAILTKWLVGLLVFAPWGVVILIQWLSKKEYDLKSYLKALGISVLVALPWQLYIFIRFPEVAKFEMEYNSRHFFEVIEGHAGDWGFHFDTISRVFFGGEVVLILLIFSAITLFTAGKKTKILWGVLAFSSLLIYVFFSIAATKMNSFVAPAFPLIILLMTFPLAYLLENIQNKVVYGVAFMLVFLVCGNYISKPLNTIEMYGFEPGSKNKEISDLLNLQLDFIQSQKQGKSEDIVINGFLREQGGVSWQFFKDTKVISAIPSESDILALQNAGYNISCIQWFDTLPRYILTNPKIETIQFE
jgi:uncharacterized membrane protein